MNIIPLHLLELFREVSAKNRSQDGRHVETLAYLFGYKDDQNHIATHLIFPEQESTCSRVDDKGMFFFKYLLREHPHMTSNVFRAFLTDTLPYKPI